jgi:hypothetical protein
VEGDTEQRILRWHGKKLRQSTRRQKSHADAGYLNTNPWPGFARTHKVVV